MKNHTHALTILIGMLAPAIGFAADITVGTVLAFDRKANLIVMTDRTVWSLEGTTARMPDGLAAGDRVQFSYEGGEEGVGDILEINIIRETLTRGESDKVDGTVLAFDRSANRLVLADRTAWSLEGMKQPLPAAIKSGDRIEIEYESDEDGVLVVHEIRILNY